MLCVYPTVKYVQIQDTRLVVLRYFLLTIIAIYVGFFELFAMGGWLQSSQVVGVVRFSLQQPTHQNCDPNLPTCYNSFLPLDQLSYCQQSSAHANYTGQVYPCEIYEAMNAQIITEKSLTVITRASTIPQEFVCGHNDNTSGNNNNNNTCPKTYKNLEPEYKFYTAQSESFTVLIDHAVTASKICTSTSHHHGILKRKNNNNNNYACSAESPIYQGRLLSTNHDLCQEEYQKNNSFANFLGDTPTTTSPCYINPNKTTTSHQDFFSLDVLLQAAGISLDDCNQLGSSTTTFTTSTTSGNNNNNKCQTYRDSGATLLLNVYWNDFVSYRGLVEPHYYYAPQLVARSSFKTVEAFYNNNYRQSRTLLNAHGIRIAVLLGGEFHQFDPLAFAITLTTAFGLLALATTIVDSLMLYILPEKRRYRQAVFEDIEHVFESNDVVSNAVRTGIQQTTNVVRSGIHLVTTATANAGSSSTRRGTTISGTTSCGDNNTGDDTMTEPLLTTTTTTTATGVEDT